MRNCPPEQVSCSPLCTLGKIEFCLASPFNLRRIDIDKPYALGSGFEADPERIAITDAQLDRFAIQRAQDRSDDDTVAHRLAAARP